MDDYLDSESGNTRPEWVGRLGGSTGVWTALRGAVSRTLSVVTSGVDPLARVQSGHRRKHSIYDAGKGLNRTESAGSTAEQLGRTECINRKNGIRRTESGKSICSLNRMASNCSQAAPFKLTSTHMQSDGHELDVQHCLDLPSYDHAGRLEPASTGNDIRVKTDSESLSCTVNGPSAKQETGTSTDDRDVNSPDGTTHRVDASGAFSEPIKFSDIAILQEMAPQTINSTDTSITGVASSSYARMSSHQMLHSSQASWPGRSNSTYPKRVFSTQMGTESAVTETETESRSASSATGTSGGPSSRAAVEAVCQFTEGQSLVWMFSGPVKGTARMREKLAEYAREEVPWPLCAQV